MNHLPTNNMTRRGAEASQLAKSFTPRSIGPRYRLWLGNIWAWWKWRPRVTAHSLGCRRCGNQLVEQRERRRGACRDCRTAIRKGA